MSITAPTQPRSSRSVDRRLPTSRMAYVAMGVLIGIVVSVGVGLVAGVLLNPGDRLASAGIAALVLGLPFGVVVGAMVGAATHMFTIGAHPESEPAWVHAARAQEQLAR